MLEADAALVEQRPVVVVGRDDGELRLVEADVALEQRQRAPADRAEADHHDGAVETGVDRPFGHRAASLCSAGSSRHRPKGAVTVKGGARVVVCQSRI